MDHIAVKNMFTFVKILDERVGLKLITAKTRCYVNIDDF